MRIDEAVIISLPEREDRLRKFRATRPHPWPFPPVRLVPGVRKQAPPWYTAGDAAYGCREAHLKVLNQQWLAGVESTLVLEDDALFRPDFHERWPDVANGVPDRWDMLMLGGQHVKPPTPAGLWVKKCVATRLTHAYVIRLKAIPYLMRVWMGSRGHIDRAAETFQREANVYAPTEWLVGQGAGWSDISHRPMPARL